MQVVDIFCQRRPVRPLFVSNNPSYQMCKPRILTTLNRSTLINKPAVFSSRAHLMRAKGCCCNMFSYEPLVTRPYYIASY